MSLVTYHDDPQLLVHLKWWFSCSCMVYSLSVYLPGHSCVVHYRHIVYQTVIKLYNWMKIFLVLGLILVAVKITNVPFFNVVTGMVINENNPSCVRWTIIYICEVIVSKRCIPTDVLLPIMEKLIFYYYYLAKTILKLFSFPNWFCYGSASQFDQDKNDSI